MRYVQGAGIDEPLAESSSAGADYYNADGLGSVTSLADGSGTPQATFVYGAFGVLKSSTGSLANEYRYTAREYDQDTGLYYYRARYYESATGRFLNEDPIGFQGGEYNFYQFVRDNPITLIDPSGLAPCDKADRKCLNSFIATVQHLFPGSTYDENANTMTVPAGYTDVIGKLRSQGYVDGITNYAWNISDHAGGHEFRTLSTAFHFKVKYPAPGGGKCQLDDFHIDNINPITDPIGHFIEFLQYHGFPVGNPFGFPGWYM